MTSSHSDKHPLIFFRNCITSIRPCSCFELSGFIVARPLNCNYLKQTSSAPLFHALIFLFRDLRWLTSGESVPNLQAIVAAEHSGRRLRVRLQLEALELQNDFRHLGGEDHEGAVKVVGVLLRKAGRLDDTAAGGEVPGTFRTWDGEKRAYEFWIRSLSKRIKGKTNRRRNMVVCVVLHECLVYGPWWRPTLPGMRFVASFFGRVV